MTQLYLKMLDFAAKFVSQDRSGEIKDLMPDLHEAKFFDLREVYSIMIDLSLQLERRWVRPATADALPFRAIVVQDSEYGGIFLRRRGTEIVKHFFSNGVITKARPLGTGIDGLEKSILNAAELMAHEVDDDEALSLAAATEFSAIAALAIINSPRIVAAEPVALNWTQRRKLKALGAGPDLAFTKIRLKVHRSQEDGGPEGGETLTGQKALHMCRQHLRILPSGRLTWVREHWRGNAANGVRIGHYEVKP